MSRIEHGFAADQQQLHNSSHLLRCHSQNFLHAKGRLQEKYPIEYSFNSLIRFYSVRLIAHVTTNGAHLQPQYCQNTQSQSLLRRKGQMPGRRSAILRQSFSMGDTARVSRACHQSLAKALFGRSEVQVRGAGLPAKHIHPAMKTCHAVSGHGHTTDFGQCEEIWMAGRAHRQADRMHPACKLTPCYRELDCSPVVEKDAVICLDTRTICKDQRIQSKTENLQRSRSKASCPQLGPGTLACCH